MYWQSICGVQVAYWWWYCGIVDLKLLPIEWGHELFFRGQLTYDLILHIVIVLILHIAIVHVIVVIIIIHIIIIQIIALL